MSNIESSSTSLGWVGFAFAEEAGDTVRRSRSRPSPTAAIEPSAETISDNTYPLSRPLFIYVNKAKAEENAALAPVRRLLPRELAEFVESGGYVTMPDEQVEATITVWTDR